MDRVEQERLSEMANVGREDSGLPMNVYISDRQNDSEVPFLGVQTDYSHKFKKDLLVRVSIAADPQIVAGEGLAAKDFAAVRRFVIANEGLLLRYWNQEIDIWDMLQGLAHP